MLCASKALANWEDFSWVRIGCNHWSKVDSGRSLSKSGWVASCVAVCVVMCCCRESARHCALLPWIICNSASFVVCTILSACSLMDGWNHGDVTSRVRLAFVKPRNSVDVNCDPLPNTRVSGWPCAAVRY